MAGSSKRAQRTAGPTTAKKGRASGDGGGDAAADRCDLEIKAPVTGPNAAVLGTLRVGSQLAVRAVSRRIEVVAPSGQVLGSIVGAADAGTLLTCIAQKNTYVATIAKISGGLVEVVITRDAP